MKRIALALLLTALPALAGLDILRTIDFSQPSAPTIDAYQANRLPVLWTVKSGGRIVDLTGYTGIMYWASNATDVLTVAATCALVDASNGTFRAVWSTANLNTTGTMIYGVGLATNGYPTIARQGALTIAADPYSAPGGGALNMITNEPIFLNSVAFGITASMTNQWTQTVTGTGNLVKAVADALYQTQGQYQVSGNYQTSGAYQAAGNYGTGNLVKVNADALYQSSVTRTLKNSAGETMLDWEAGKLFWAGTTGLTASIYWDYGAAYDSFGDVSFHWDTRDLVGAWTLNGTNIASGLGYLTSEGEWTAVSNAVRSGAALGATAVQPATLAAHTNLLVADRVHGMGTAAAQDTGAFATAAQGIEADDTSALTNDFARLSLANTFLQTVRGSNGFQSGRQVVSSSVTTVQQVQVTGTLTPAATGVYASVGIYLGQSNAYERGIAYRISFGAGNSWFINTIPSGGAWWTSAPGQLYGAYAPGGTAVGTATNSTYADLLTTNINDTTNVVWDNNTAVTSAAPVIGHARFYGGSNGDYTADVANGSNLTVGTVNSNRLDAATLAWLRGYITSGDLPVTNATLAASQVLNPATGYRLWNFGSVTCNAAFTLTNGTAGQTIYARYIGGSTNSTGMSYPAASGVYTQWLSAGIGTTSTAGRSTLFSAMYATSTNVLCAIKEAP